MDLQVVVPQLLSILAAWGVKIVAALALFVVGRLAARWVRRILVRVLQRAETDRTLVPYLSGLGYYLTMVFVAIAVLGVVGIQTASVIAVLGAAGLAVGLALQGTLSNFAAGIMLLVFRPFRVGEYVEVGGEGGSVQSIGLFSLTLNTPDNVQVVMPNSMVWGDKIKNYAANDTRRNDMVVGVSYDDDLETAVGVIRELLAADPRVLDDPAPAVAVAELADSSVNIVVRPWCARQDYWDLRFDLTRRMKEALEGAGCSIPFPQRDLHLFEAKPTA